MAQDEMGSARGTATVASGEFLLELRLDIPDTPVGTIRARPGRVARRLPGWSSARRFHGWLEFMALLDQLRSEATAVGSEPAAEPTSETGDPLT